MLSKVEIQDFQKNIDLFEIVIRQGLLTFIAGYDKNYDPSLSITESKFLKTVELLVDRLSSDTSLPNRSKYIKKIQPILDKKELNSFESIEFFDVFKFSLLKPLLQCIKKSTYFKEDYQDFYKKVNPNFWISYPITKCYMLWENKVSELDGRHNPEWDGLDLFNCWSFFNEQAMNHIENSFERRFTYIVLPDFEICSKTYIQIATGGRIDGKIGGGIIREFQLIEGKPVLNYTKTNWLS